MYIDNIDDCNALLFFQICSGEKEYTSLYVKGFKNEKKALKAWINLYDEYIKNFGIPETYSEYLKKRIKANKVWIDVLVKNKTSRRRKAEILESEASQMMKQDETNSNNIGVLSANISKQFGFNVDPSKVSVRQFYSYLKTLEESK